MQPQENVIVQWQEPEAASLPGLSGQRGSLVWGGLGLLFVGLLGYGIWRKDATFYLGAAAILAAAASLASQNRRSSGGRTIALTADALMVGGRAYSLKDLAGFWLHADGGQLIVNMETKRRSALPLALIYQGTDADEARRLFLQVLPELEPRETTITDTVSRWLRP